MYDLPVGTIVTVKTPVSNWSGYTMDPGVRGEIVDTQTVIMIPAYGTIDMYRVRFLDSVRDAFDYVMVDPTNVEVLKALGPEDDDWWDQDFRHGIDSL